MIEYTPEDYEFALRILHHREDFTEEEVSRWMDEPEHLEVLREMSFVNYFRGAVSNRDDRRKIAWIHGSCRDYSGK